MAILGCALRGSRPEEALSVLEGHLAVLRRHWPHEEEASHHSQINRAICLFGLGRNDEALVLRREIYARDVAIFGSSHERTLLDGNNLGISLNKLELYDEARSLLRDQLLPAARRSLGPDHDTTLKLSHNLAENLYLNPEQCDDLCLNRRGVDATRF